MRLIVSDWKKTRRHINQVKYKRGQRSLRGRWEGSHRVQREGEGVCGGRGGLVGEGEGNWEKVGGQMEGVEDKSRRSV